MDGPGGQEESQGLGVQEEEGGGGAWEGRTRDHGRRDPGNREGEPGEEEQQVPKGRRDQGPPEDSGGAGRGYQEPAGGACQVSVLVPCYNSDAFLRLFNC